MTRTIHNIFRHYAICFKALLLTIGLTFSLSSQVIFATEQSGVLVVSKQSSVKKISRKELRRIFLGISPSGKTGIQKPVLNTSDPATYNLFLKNILFLTEDGYKRKLIKRVFRQGADYIQRFDTVDHLEKHLLENVNDISFMSQQQAAKHPQLKVVQVLW